METVKKLPETAVQPGLAGLSRPSKKPSTPAVMDSQPEFSDKSLDTLPYNPTKGWRFKWSFATLNLLFFMIALDSVSIGTASPVSMPSRHTVSFMQCTELNIECHQLLVFWTVPTFSFISNFTILPHRLGEEF